MVTPQLAALAAAAKGAGRIECAESTHACVGTGRAEHPMCGDEVEVDLAVDAGRIVDLRWRAHGCPATYAVAAVAHAALVGWNVDGATQRLREALAQRGDLAKTERHAEAMFGRALAAALAARGGPGV